MTYDEFVVALQNVQLTCQDNYTEDYQADIAQKQAQFDPVAYQQLQAIQPGSAWAATIVLDADFQLINGTLTQAGPTIAFSNPSYQEVANMIRAILPDASSRTAFNKYIDAKSTIYSTAIVKPWTPTRVQITGFGLDWGAGSVMIVLSCIPHP